jgi:hypothetical protein
MHSTTIHHPKSGSQTGSRLVPEHVRELVPIGSHWFPKVVPEFGPVTGFGSRFPPRFPKGTEGRGTNDRGVVDEVIFERVVPGTNPVGNQSLKVGNQSGAER